MAKDNRCKCTLAQSLVGDGCRYCQPQDYIDRLRDEIKDMQEEYDKLFNEKATVYHLTADAPSWQGLELEKVTQIIHGLEDKLGMPIVGAIAVARAIEQALKEKNHG